MSGTEQVCKQTCVCPPRPPENHHGNDSEKNNSTLGALDFL